MSKATERLSTTNLLCCKEILPNVDESPLAFEGCQVDTKPLAELDALNKVTLSSSASELKLVSLTAAHTMHDWTHTTEIDSERAPLLYGIGRESARDLPILPFPSRTEPSWGRMFCVSFLCSAAIMSNS